MQPITRRTALASGAALTAGATLAACSGGDDGVDEDFQNRIDTPDDNVITDADDPQIVTEKTEVTFMSGRPPTTARSTRSRRSTTRTSRRCAIRRRCGCARTGSTSSGWVSPRRSMNVEEYLREAVGSKDGAVGMANNGVGSLVEALLGTFEIGNNGPDVGSVAVSTPIPARCASIPRPTVIATCSSFCSASTSRV